MKCGRCSFENPDRVKFCVECGGRLEILCPGCNFSNPPQFKFCGECGHSLAQTKEPASTSIDYTKPPSYTPKHLADQILTSRSAVEGERKIVTVLFADVANFTALSEKLDPEEVHQILDGCFQILMAEIHRYEGTINQFTGDGVMALFGAPLAHEDHAQRACHAALAIQKAMGEYGERIQKQYSLPFHLRIGLNSGPVVVGKIGDDLRMDYTAIGDTTNLAARMQSLAQPGTTLSSSHTHHLAQDFFSFQPLGKLRVKGKEEPQEAYQLLKATQVVTRLAAAAAKGLTKFIGRENEIQTLLNAYAKVQSGSGQVVGIVGEAGVGKSRLLLEFRHLVSGDSLYLEGRCLHYGGSMIYLPFLDILRSYLELREGDSEPLIRRKLSGKVIGLDVKLQSSLPPFQELLSLKVEDQTYLQLEPRQKKERTFEALRDLFLRESQERPLLLILEDLHWIDKTSEEFLGYLIDWLAKTRILLVLVYRPEYAHPWTSKSYYSKIGLDQLPLTSSAELVQALLVGGEVASDLRQLILDRAAGNPLFMEELTHSLIENGSIRKQDHQYVLSGSPSEIPVPDTIQGVIAARMDRLEEAMKRILQVASVIGRGFAFRILQAISGMQEELKSNLRNLQGLEFIYEKRLFPELEYIFKHALIQEVAYNSLLLKRRKEIHERIGLAIEQIYAERVEEFYEVLAYHFEKAGFAEKAVKYLHFAGERAVRLSANEEAIVLFDRALELLRTLPESRSRNKQELTLQLALGAPLRCVRSWGPPELGQAATRSLELARQMGERPQVIAALRNLHSYHFTRGENRTALKLAEQLLHLAQPEDPIEMMSAHRSMGSSLFYMGEFRQARIHFERVMELYDAQKHFFLTFQQGWDARVIPLSHDAYDLWISGYPDQGLKRVQEMMALAREVDHLFTLTFACANSAHFHWLRREPEKVRQYAEEHLRCSIEGGFQLLQATGTIALGWVQVMQGEVENGIARMNQVLDAYRSMTMIFTSFYLAEKAAVYGILEKTREGLDLIEEALDIVQKTEECWCEAEAHRIKGELLQLSGRPFEAERAFCQAIEVTRRQEAKSWELRATLSFSRLLRKQGRSEEARKLLSEIYGWFTEGFDTPDLKEAGALLEELGG
jgi:class 3 adenylate cyclase/predicted ATPase